LVYPAVDLLVEKQAQKLILYADKEIGLNVNAEKTRYTFMPLHHNAGQKRNVNAVNTSLKTENFEHLGTTVINQKNIRGGITNGWCSVIAGSPTFQNAFSFALQYRNINMKYTKIRTHLLYVKLYGFEGLM
jgi:hypothetical protein